MEGRKEKKKNKERRKRKVFLNLLLRAILLAIHIMKLVAAALLCSSAVGQDLKLSVSTDGTYKVT